MVSLPLGDQPGTNQEGTVTPRLDNMAGAAGSVTGNERLLPRKLYLGFGVLICVRFESNRVECCPTYPIVKIRSGLIWCCISRSQFWVIPGFPYCGAE